MRNQDVRLKSEFLISLESEIRGAKARKRDRCAFMNRSTGAETAFGDTTNIGVVTACRGDKLDDVNAREGDCFCSGNSCSGGPRTGTDTGTGRRRTSRLPGWGIRPSKSSQLAERILWLTFLTKNPATPTDLKDLARYHPGYVLVTHSHGDHLGDAIELAKI